MLRLSSGEGKAMPRPLTFEERAAASLSLKGERLTHRRWPKEVVEAFVRADVAPATIPLRPTPVYKRLLPSLACVLPRRVAGLYSDEY